MRSSRSTTRAPSKPSSIAVGASLDSARAGGFALDSVEIRSSSHESAGDVAVGIFQKIGAEDARSIGRTAIEAFTSGEVDRVMIVHNEFKSVMSQRVVFDQLLPIPRGELGDVASGGAAPAACYLQRHR